MSAPSTLTVRARAFSPVAEPPRLGDHLEFFRLR